MLLFCAICFMVSFKTWVRSFMSFFDLSASTLLGFSGSSVRNERSAQDMVGPPLRANGLRDHFLFFLLSFPVYGQIFPVLMF